MRTPNTNGEGPCIAHAEVKNYAAHFDLLNHTYTAPLQKVPDNIAIRRLKTKKKIKGRKETEKTAEERRTHRV